MEKKKIFDERSTLIELIEYGATIRGKVISRFILLEDVINLFLTFQFSGEKEGILLESLFTTNKITFDSKRKLFISIINKHHAGFANINKGDKKSPGITTRLQLLSEERNVFAHNSLDTGKESVRSFYDKKTLTFGKFLGDANPKIYTQKQVSDLLYRFTVAINLINSLNIPT